VLEPERLHAAEGNRLVRFLVGVEAVEAQPVRRAGLFLALLTWH